jgi:hypothetical protein
VVDARRGNRDARVVRAQDEIHTAVGELLRDGHAGLRVPGVVFGHELEAQRAAAALQVPCVEIVEREPHAVFVVLAGERVRTRQRAAHADPDDLLLGQHRRAGKQQQRQAGSAFNTRLRGSAVLHLICSIENADETPASWAVLISFL